MVEKALLYVQSYIYFTDLIPKREIGYIIRNWNKPFLIAELKVLKIHFSNILFPAGIYLLKVNKKITRTNMLKYVLVSLLLTLNIFHTLF